MSLREIASEISQHNITSLELTQTLLDEIQRTDSKLKAYVTINPSVEEDAKTADLELKSGRPRGPLHGIPITIKDNFETAGIRTTCGSKLLKDYVPNADATAVARLKEAGALVLGKANTHEFALGVITPPTRNPWNLNCVPGGSSGGSAAAVAAGSAIAATG